MTSVGLRDNLDQVVGLLNLLNSVRFEEISGKGVMGIHNILGLLIDQVEQIKHHLEVNC